MKYLFSIMLYLLTSFAVKAQPATQADIDSLPVRGFAIEAPRHKGLPQFLKFIDEELGPRGINTLILRVDYAYQYKSHPELIDEDALSSSDAKKIVKACKKYNIQIIPQINLLGHQSWANKLGKLLAVYPEFDETPHVKIPENHVWPNPDGLYCKSYCPLHPGVHKVVFDLVDEVCDVFESSAFHAGMDEVFYIGDDKCPRCAGKDKAELFAGELQKIRNHLQIKNRKLWIWGDRLLDATTTGLGMWEASMNNTHRAIDLIPKDVVICDWHYERPDQTAVYFATKGFNVLTCTWRDPKISMTQMEDMVRFRKNSTPQMKANFKGIIQTIWSPADAFLKEFYSNEPPLDLTKSPATTFKTIFKKI